MCEEKFYTGVSLSMGIYLGRLNVVDGVCVADGWMDGYKVDIKLIWINGNLGLESGVGLGERDVC